MIRIDRGAYEALGAALLRNPPECGGVLGAVPGEPVSRFYFDESGVSTPDSYTPDYTAINAVLDLWERDNVVMVGMAHSHGGDDGMPSCGDLFYCERILLANPALAEFILPVVSHGTGRIDVYVCSLIDGHIRVREDGFEVV